MYDLVNSDKKACSDDANEISDRKSEVNYLDTADPNVETTNHGTFPQAIENKATGQSLIN